MTITTRRGRASIMTDAVLGIISDAEQELDLNPDELKLRLAVYFRAELDDHAQEIIAEQQEIS
jgi:hypothetical protein